MGVPFTQIPAALLVPGQYQEIDNSLAGSVGDIKKALIVAYMSAAGTAGPGVPVRVLSDLKAAELFGYGSPAALLSKAFLELNKIEECWVLPVAEPAAGTRWQKSFTVSVTTAGAGAVSISVNGVKLEAAAVSAGADAVAVASAIVARINSDTTLPVEAEAGENGAFTVILSVPQARLQALRLPPGRLLPGRRRRRLNRFSRPWAGYTTTISSLTLVTSATFPPLPVNLKAATARHARSGAALLSRFPAGWEAPRKKGASSPRRKRSTVRISYLCRA
jgi:hypothetical protein